MEKEEGKRSEHTVWGDIGLTKYNPQAEKWECRFADCQQIMDKELLMHNHRIKKHPDPSLGGTDRKQHARTASRPTAQPTRYSCASNSYYRSMEHEAQKDARISRLKIHKWGDGPRYFSK